MEGDIPDFAKDHSGLETVPFTDCLRLLPSVPVGRVAFHADGEVVVLPVNHLVDGQDIVFRTATGSKLSAAEKAGIVAFEADDYDAQAKSGWSVVVNGRAEILYENTETQRLDGLSLHPWPTAVDREFWIRIRPTSVSGRQIPSTPPADHHRRALLTYRGQASESSTTATRSRPCLCTRIEAGARVSRFAAPPVEVSYEPLGEPGRLSCRANPPAAFSRWADAADPQQDRPPARQHNTT